MNLVSEPAYPPDYGYREPAPYHQCWRCRGNGLINVRGVTVECPDCEGEGEYEVKPEVP